MDNNPRDKQDNNFPNLPLIDEFHFPQELLDYITNMFVTKEYIDDTFKGDGPIKIVD